MSSIAASLSIFGSDGFFSDCWVVSDGCCDCCIEGGGGECGGGCESGGGECGGGGESGGACISEGTIKINEQEIMGEYFLLLLIYYVYIFTCPI